MSLRAVTGTVPSHEEQRQADRRARRPGAADVRRLFADEDPDPDDGSDNGYRAADIAGTDRSGGAGAEPHQPAPWRRGPLVHAQPILDLVTGTASGYEALARFPELPGTSPDDWFAAAHRAGVGAKLEARAVARALRLGARRPADTVLSVNVSPNVIDTDEFQSVLPADLDGLQFEVTEHQLADSARALLTALDELRRRGATIAIDDVGTGYAGFKRLMAVRPDVLKLDRTLVAGISVEPRKVALIEAIVHFASRTGARVCAEGLETVEDLVTVAELDVALGQGWVIGRPAADFPAISAEARAASAVQALRTFPATDPAAAARDIAPDVAGSRPGPRDVPGPTAPGAPGDRLAPDVSALAAADVPTPVPATSPASSRSFLEVAEVLEALAEVTTLRGAAVALAMAAPLLACDEVRLAVMSPKGRTTSNPRTQFVPPRGGRAADAEPSSVLGPAHDAGSTGSCLRLLPADGAGTVRRWAWHTAPAAWRALADRELGQAFLGTARQDTAEQRLLVASASRSMLLLPLVAAGRSAGILACLRHYPNPWTRAELRLARLVAAAVGPAVARLPLG